MSTFVLDKETAKSIILSRSIIEPAKGDVQIVNATVTNVNYSEQYDKHFVSFNLTTHTEMKKGLAHYKEDNLQDATNCNLTLGMFANQTPPAKGDSVKVTVERVDLRDGGKDFRPQRVVVLGTSDTASAKDSYENAFE